MNSEKTEAGEEKKYEIPYTLKLAYPVQWGKDETKSELVFARRPKAKDYKNINPSNIRMSDMISLLAKLTGEPVSMVEELDAQDLFAATEVINSFLPGGQMTGGEQLG